jgi:fibronectin type 3 domain-containing protein
MATQYINISNTGGGTLTRTASDPVDWLIKGVDGGTGNGSLQIDVYPEYFGGAPGTYTTTVTISASGASGSPKTIPVTMNIGGGSGGGGGGTASVTLIWSANGESDLQGYRVYYGTSSRNYTTNTDVGKVTSYTVNGLATGTTYYFAITALDTSGNESGYSSEVLASR